MGKNRHSKDKLYIVASEYGRDWGGYKKRGALPFRSLPFYCCGLSLLPFTTPVCTSEGIVFDADNIFAYIDKYHRNPVTGEPLSKKQLIPLRFHKNSDDKFHCPVTYKEFNEHTHIVANGKSGHVYSHEAIDSLCRRPKLWVDLITSDPFSSSDLICIQNPHDVAVRKIEEFDYIKTAKDVPPPMGIAADEGSFEPGMKRSELSDAIIAEMKEEEIKLKATHNELIPSATNTKTKSEIKSETTMKKHSLFTTHHLAASFTSTAVVPSYTAEFRDLTDREQRLLDYAEIRKKKAKGYIRLTTNLGILNIELHCDKAPETCDNFLRHCQAGYYKDTIFHRSIVSFMIQGGDPTGTGTGGESAFEGGKPFPDEFHPHMLHKGSGVLSMANSGPHSNKSQFFITYKSCEHLNNKHTVFGKVVKGLDTLQKMEKLETDAETNKPKAPPVIEEVTVFKNPYLELKEEKKKLIEEEAAKESKAVLASKTTAEILDPMQHHAKRQTTEVGKYTITNAKPAPAEPVEERKRPSAQQLESLTALKKNKQSGFSFSNW